MKVLLKLLPQNLRDQLYRQMVPLDNYQQRVQGIEIKLATEKEELESAYKLLHDVYVKQGLMDSHASGMRVNLYSALPYTSVIVAKVKDKVVGTVSLIKDSPLGLPSDKEYKAENTIYRRKGERLVEVSALAVHADYRKNSQGSLVSLLLMNYLRRYSASHMGATMLAAVVHPKTRSFYRAMFGFVQNGRIVKYEFVKKALGMHITSSLDTVVSTISKTPKIQNFFVNDPLPQVLQYPGLSSGVLLNPVMTADLLRYFFMEKTNLFAELKPSELEQVKSAYELHFPLDGLDCFKSITAARKGFRYQSQIEAVVVHESRLMQGVIFDLSTSGAFLRTAEALKPGEEVSLSFTCAGNRYKLKAQVVRINPSQLDFYPQGIGIRFKGESAELVSLLKQHHQAPQATQKSA